MVAQTCSAQTAAIARTSGWERCRARLKWGCWSAFVRFAITLALAGAAASAPALAADMPQRGRCSVGPGTTALLKRVQLRPAKSVAAIVFTFEGNRIPQPRLQSVTPPIREDGSGNPVQVAGSRFLEINMQPASGVYLSGPQFRQVYRGPRRIAGRPGSPVRELVQTGDFEAVLTWVAGLDRQRPFSVRTACNPARLTVQIGR
jgi:hypothetical protein